MVVDSCATVTCRHGARCEHGRCVCPQKCPPESGEAICASDGRTYASECLMRLAACQRSVDLDVVSRAPCDRDDVISGSGDGEFDSSPVSIQTQSLALRTLRALRKRKPQETQALALASSQSWLPLLRPSIPIGWRLRVSCGFRLRNARNASDCV